LTRNPGASFTGSGSLSIWRTKAAPLAQHAGVACPRPSHDLDQLHLRHRVEEVDADEPRRVAQRRGDVGERRLDVFVARTASGRAALERANSSRLASRFSKIASMITSARARPSPGRPGSGGRARRAGPLVAQAPPKSSAARDRGGNALGRLILQRHRQAAQRADGGDVAAHHAGADHVHMPRREVHALAEALQALLQEEHADQVARGRVSGSAAIECRIVGRRERVAVVLRPRSMIAYGAG
jgi:hypothetical protein